MKTINQKKSDIISELQDNPIVLEMQMVLKTLNEINNQADISIEKTRQNYIEFYDSILVDIITFNKSGHIKHANPNAGELLCEKVNSIVSQLFYKYVYKEFIDIFYLHPNRVIKYKLNDKCELQLKTNEGTFVSLHSIDKESLSGEGLGVTNLIDINHYKDMEQSMMRNKKEHELIIKQLKEDIDENKNSALNIARALNMKDERCQYGSKKNIPDRKLTNNVKYVQPDVNLKKTVFENIITDDPKMFDIFEFITKTWNSNTSVLITGKTGTGKEAIAKAIHKGSYRRFKPFVSVSCPNLPSGLIDSELFGHEKGAFTGANEKRIGKFELSNSGTLFLDEIGVMDLSLQTKLLRILQEKEFSRLGSSKILKIDVKIIAATNKNLKNEINKGNFREDLFYRLNIIPVHLPSLRERKCDIPLLVDYFIKKFKTESGCNTVRFSLEALKAFQNYDWPGNIRELENIVQRKLLLFGNLTEISVENLPQEIIGNRTANQCTAALASSNKNSLKNNISQMEKEIILAAVEQSNGNFTLAARKLKTTPRILRYKFAKLSKNLQ